MKRSIFRVLHSTLLVFSCSLMAASANAQIESSPVKVDLFSLQPDASGTGPISAGTTFRLRGFGLYSQASSHINLGDDVPGTIHNIDLEDVLGMDLDKASGGALVGVDFGRFHFDLSYNGYYDYSGRKDVGSISIDGKVYTDIVESSAKLQEGNARFGFDLWKADGLGLTLTPIIDFHLFYLDFKISEANTALSDSWQLWAPIPALGMTLRYDVTPNIYVKGTAAGLYFGDYGYFADLSAELGYDLTRNLGVFVGYRYWIVNIDYNDNSFDLNNSAVYAGVELRM